MDSMYFELHERLSRLMWLMHRQHMKNRAQNGPFADSTRGQGRVLSILKLQEEISTRDLSYLLGIRQQSLNELLNRLEKGGYVVRIPSKEDGRVMLVQLTQKGREEKLPQAGGCGIFECLNEKEQAELSGYLEKLIAALEEKLGGDPMEGEHGCMSGPHPGMGDGRFKRMMGARFMCGDHHTHDRHHGHKRHECEHNCHEDEQD